MRFAITSLIISFILSPLSSLAQINTPPAFLEGVTTPEQFKALTPEQQEEAKAFFQTYTPPVPTAPPRTGEIVVHDVLTCDDYFSFGSVQVDLTPTSDVAVAGTPFAFVGTITNNNPYPIVNGSVFVKIFKYNANEEGARLNGHPVVDQFVALRDISLAANASESFEIPYDVPVSSQNGVYEIATYFLTHDRFNISGLSYTDDVAGSRASFTIEGGRIDGVGFDKSRVYLSNTEYHTAAFPPRFAKDEAVVFAAPVINTTSETVNVTVAFDLYDWDGIREEQKLDSKKEGVTLAPGEETVLYYEASKATGALSFIRATLMFNDTASILNTRFVRDDIAETRLVFPSVTSYPLKKGEESTLFSCLQSTNLPLVEGNTLTLTLADSQGKKIHSYTYEGGVTGAMVVKDAFTPQKTLTDFTLTASLSRDGQVIEEVTNTYRCADIDPSMCIAGAGAEDGTNLLLVSVVALLLITLIVMILKRFGFFAPTLMVAFTLVVLGATTPHAQAQSKSVTWTSGSLASLIGRFDHLRQISTTRNTSNTPLSTTVPCSAYGCFDLPMFGTGANFTSGSITINAPDPVVNAAVTYKAALTNADTGAVISDNATLPVGTRVRVQRDTSTLSTDARFYGQINNWAGHFGPVTRASFSKTARWVNSAGPVSNACQAADLVWTGPGTDATFYADLWDYYLLFNINPPTTSVVGGSGPVSCVGDICTINSPGAVSVRLDVSPTNGMFYNRIFVYYPYTSSNLGCHGSNSFATSIPVPAQSITFNLTGTAPVGSPPAGLVIRGNNTLTQPALATATVGASIPFYFRADDPDNNTIKYEFKWNDISSSSSLPSSGYVADLTVLNTTRTFSTAGTYTLRVVAIDSNGSASAAVTHVITVSAAPAATLSATACTIPAGGSTCSTTLAWSAGGTVAPWEILHNNKVPAPDWVSGVSGSSGSIAYTVPYGTQNFVLQSDSNNIANASAVASCASGSTWNGTLCTTTLPSTPTFTNTTCTILAGDSQCTSLLDWNLTGQASPNIYNQTSATNVSTAVTGTAVSRTFAYRAIPYTLQARSNTTVLVTRNITTICAAGTSWNGTACVVGGVTPTLTATPCTIPAGGATCTTTLGWNAVGTIAPWEILHNNKVPSPDWVPGVGGMSGSVGYVIPIGTQTFVLQSDSNNIASASAVASCASGSAWSGITCVSTPTTLSFTVSSCSIPVGASSCISAVSWAAPGSSGPWSVRRFSPTQILPGTNMSSGNSSYTLPHGSYTFQFEYGPTVAELLYANAVASCASGSTWNGTVCAAASVTPTLTVTACTIAVEQDACNGRSTWDISAGTIPYLVRNTTTGNTIGTNPASTNVSTPMVYGNNTITASATGITPESRTVNVTCAAGLFYHTDLLLLTDRCKARPVISMTPDVAWVRSGESADVSFTVTANYPARCTISGGVPAGTSVMHNGSPLLPTITHSGIITNSLTSAQVVKVTCEANTTPSISSSAASSTMMINVVPIYEEI